MTRPRGAYVEAADRYIDAVLSKQQPASKWVRFACERQYKDRKRSLQRKRDFPYVFDVDAAEAICEFGEMLPHTKGRWAKRRETFVLGDWQCFLLTTLYGWLLRKGQPRAGLRRFLEAYWEICRKNGKSPLAAIIGNYMWCMDGEMGAEVYSGATSEKQAWEVFLPAKTMVEKSPELIEELVGRDGDVRDIVKAKKLVIPGDNSRFEPVIGDPGDGSSPSCGIADEYHEHDTNDLVETFRTGMIGREQPLLLQITTAGTNLAGPCYDKHLEVKKVLQGIVENEQLFGIIYGIDEDEGDDWADPKMLPKANPNFGVSVDPDIVRAMQRQAVLNPVDQVAFKTKHLNVWCAAKMVWMPLHVWDLCAMPEMEEKEFGGQPCYVVLDLASKDDIAAKVKIFWKRLKGVKHYYSFENYYLPASVLEVPGPNQSGYRKWAKEGWLTLTPGHEIDFSRIEADVLGDPETKTKGDKDKHQILEIVYDPWRATQMAQGFAKRGATVVELRQITQNFSEPMKELLAACKGGRYHHVGNPVTRWMMSNVVAKTDARDTLNPQKEKPHMKIDGAVAIIMGMNRAMLATGGSIADWLNDPVVIR